MEDFWIEGWRRISFVFGLFFISLSLLIEERVMSVFSFKKNLFLAFLEVERERKERVRKRRNDGGN